ncbi:MAG: YncE family protein [Halieaceae bacterium]|jgi:DNA-binding beta-propeller fold protein YncE|nr:YncE family protein [Halieaceae bacterium]
MIFTLRILLVVFTLFVIPGSRAATLLVANKSEATVSLFDLPTAQLRTTLPTGVGPHEVAVSPDGQRALVSNYGTRELPGNSLTVVDVPGARVIGTITLAAGTKPHGVEWLDKQRAVITAEGTRSLLVVDVDSLEVTQTVAVDQDVGHMVAVSADLGRAYVANIGSGTVSVIDLAEGRKISDLSAGEGSEGIALADSQQLWVTNRAAGTVSVFDSNTLVKLEDIQLPGFPIRAEADDPRGRVYVTLPQADALAVIDRESREEHSRLQFDVPPDRSRKTLFGDMLPDSSIPIGVLLSGDGESLFVAHSNAHVITVYDAQSLQRRATIATGLEPDGMGWSPLDIAP